VVVVVVVAAAAVVVVAAAGVEGEIARRPKCTRGIPL